MEIKLRNLVNPSSLGEDETEKVGINRWTQDIGKKSVQIIKEQLDVNRR